MVEEVKFHKCTGKCGKTLELNKINFKTCKAAKGGFRRQCKNCYNKGKPSHIIIENGIKYQICTGDCKNKKKLNETNFGWRNKKNNIYHRQCKICIAKCKAEHYQENKEEMLLKAKEYYEENVEGILIKHKKYRKENKEKIKIKDKKRKSIPEIKKKTNERAKQRTLNDPKFKLRSNISSVIRITFKRRNTKKSRSISKSLPYTIDELITHLEMWFKKTGNEWMTLNNRGVYNPDTWDDNDKSTWVWHLDHIFPDADFNYISEDDQEFKDCWSLNNLRPLRADLNVLEGARRTRHNTKK